MLEKLNGEIKSAMKARDSKRLSTLRGIMAASKNSAIEDKRKDVSAEDITKAITKGIKQRQDSIEQFATAGRTDLVDIEKFEMEIYKEFQPKQLSEDEIIKLIDDAIAKSGASSKKEMGKVMGILMPQTKGKADGKLVSKLVGERLN